MVKTLPIEAYQLAETYQLGEPVAMYKAVFQLPYARITWPIAFLISIPLGCLLIFLASQFNFSPVIALYTTGIFLLLSLFLLNFFPYYSARKIKVYLCAAGLIYLGKHNIEAIHWDQIEKVWYDESGIRLWDKFCTIYLKNGAQLTFNPYLQRRPNMGRKIQRLLYQYRKNHQQPCC